MTAVKKKTSTQIWVMHAVSVSVHEHALHTARVQGPSHLNATVLATHKGDAGSAGQDHFLSEFVMYESVHTSCGKSDWLHTIRSTMSPGKQN
jgi:hypothetical protein